MSPGTGGGTTCASADFSGTKLKTVVNKATHANEAYRVSRLMNEAKIFMALSFCGASAGVRATRALRSFDREPSRRIRRAVPVSRERKGGGIADSRWPRAREMAME